MTTTKRKGFLRSYIQSIMGIVLIGFCVVYPYFAMQFNGPPIEAQTEVLRGEILRARKEHPNVLLKLPGGTVQALDFPGTLQFTYFAKYPDFHGENEEDLARLKGCEAEIKTDRLKGMVVSTIPRIWSLKCRKLYIPYDKLIQYYETERQFGGMQWFLYGWSLFCLILGIRGDSLDRSK